MGWLDQLKSVLRREARDARAWVEEAVADANTGLDRAERRVSDDPAERMAATLDDIEAGEAEFDRVRERAEGRSIAPAARAELGPDEGVVFDEVASTPPPTPAPPDLPPRAGSAMARVWVREAPTAARDPDTPGSDDAPGAGTGDVTLLVDGVVGRVVDTGWFPDGLAAALADLPEVAEATATPGTPGGEVTVRLRGPDLTASRAREIVVDLLAPHIGEDWQTRLAKDPGSSDR